MKGVIHQSGKRKSCQSVCGVCAHVRCENVDADDRHIYIHIKLQFCSRFIRFFQEEQETSYTILRARGCNVTLNGLKSNTAYLLQIRARTAAGYGASSPSFQFETSPDCKSSNTPAFCDFNPGPVLFIHSQ